MSYHIISNASLPKATRKQVDCLTWVIEGNKMSDYYSNDENGDRDKVSA